MGPARTAELRRLIAQGRYVPFAELRRGLGRPVATAAEAALAKAARAAKRKPRLPSRPPPGPLGLNAYWRRRRFEARAQ